MATADLKAFIETRLQVLSPGIDIDPGSPAQTQLVGPLVDYLGTDPFETDISTFLSDRLSQEFPNIYAGDPGVVNDTFIKPLIMFLEPFKREIQSIRRGQSLLRTDLLSDDDADALVANVFDERADGGFATGVVRVLFSNPVNIQVEITVRFFDAGGLNFFPTNPRSITAEEMVFNRQGALYFVDIPVQAEAAGTSYNITAGKIVGVSGIFGPVSVTNLQDFSNGKYRMDTPAFVAKARESLNERSLVTRPGANARINDTFKGSIKAVQVIGAKDAEMRRDILVASGPGHAWLTGRVALFQNVATIQVRTVDDASQTPIVNIGDTLYVYLDRTSLSGLWATVDQAQRFLRFTVEEVIAGPLASSVPGYQLFYMVRFSGDRPAFVPSTPIELEGGLSKKGTIQVSALPGIPGRPFEVNNQEVHVFGHTDIYVRPVIQPTGKAVISSLTNDPAAADFKLQRTSLSTFGEGALGKNKVTDPLLNFSQSGVELFDTFTIENGDDAGVYVVIKVSGNDVYLSQNLTKDNTDIRYSVTKKVSFNPFEPRVLKAPFGNIGTVNLQTSIGSNTVKVNDATTNVTELGVTLGDTLRILSGDDAGDYTITGFNVDGKHFDLDTKLTSSNSHLPYEIFTKLEAVSRPMVRIKELALLDSSQQATGVTIPPADPVGVVAMADLTSAVVRGLSQTGSGFVLPAITNSAGLDRYVTGASQAAVSGDRRYSMGFDPISGGNYLPMQSGSLAEFLFPVDAGLECSYFLATSEDDSLSENFPPIDPKPGDALTLKTGPNKGSYLVKSVYKFKHTTGGKQFWSYFIKIHGTFPVDVFRSIIEFLDSVGITTSDIKIPAATIVAFPSFFVNGYAALSTKIDAAFTASGALSPGVPAISSMVDQLAAVEYEWGDPARGSLRTYFQQPTLFQQNTGDSKNPTVFRTKTATGDVVKFRPDPNRYVNQEIVPARLNADADLLSYPRDYAQSAGVVTLTDATKPNPLLRGVSIGDWLSVHPENLFHGSTYSAPRQTAVQTTAGSTKITAPVSAGGPFSPQMVGNLVFIDEGQDIGGYRVVVFKDSSNLLLDRALTKSTPTVIAEGSGTVVYNGVDDILVSTGFGPIHTNKYATLYGLDNTYQGSYLVTYVSPVNVKLTRAGTTPLHFPLVAISTRWVITTSPVTPKVVAGGTELTGLTPIHMYSEIPVESQITDINVEPNFRIINVAGSRNSLFKEPYRVYRKDVRRVSSTEMDGNREGPFYFFDTEVVSLSPSDASNIKRGSYLTVDSGTYSSLGYRHVVYDNTLSYSVFETGHIEVTPKVLPVQSTDSVDSMLNLVGTPIQVTYDKADVVQQLQDFLSSPEDRVTVANLLARHFLPSYASFEATYSGGSATSVIAKDIISYIESLSIETPLDVSEAQRKIEDRGGNPETPTKAFTLIHDWDRKQWAEVNENKLGGDETKVPYNGTSRVLFFISGPDNSGISPIPFGEAIRLTRL